MWNIQTPSSSRLFVRIAFLGILAGTAIILLVPHERQTQAAPEPTPSKRQAWTTSKILGTPEAPPPYRVVPAFAQLRFAKPLHMTNAPGTERLFVCEQGGKILSFPNQQDVRTADVAIDLAKDLPSWKVSEKVQGFDSLYGLTFHPKFAENRYCYVCYVLKGKGAELVDGSRVSRFTVSKTDPPTIDPKSEKLLFTFLAGGHNGGCLAFGPDGCLYVTTGDAASPNPPDPLNTGQDCSDLLSSVLRIDVDREEAGKPYAIPKDNPFVGMPNVRPEIWAFGFRNPWRISFDRATGDLWLGDVGWEMWEMVYRVKKGGNYGWSIKEGPQDVKPAAKIGPTPILPPQIAFPHTEAASITGGVVYRGRKWPDLVGAYICGDWMSRKLWASRFAGDTRIAHAELAQGKQQIVAFAEDHAGELYFVDYQDQGGLYTLVPNEEAKKPQPPFPQKLSDTGLFADVAKQHPQAGVYAYQINAEPWADHATMQRFVAVPGSGAITFHHQMQPVPDTAWFKSRVFVPNHTVFVRSLSLEMERGNPASRRLMETQIMHFAGSEWRGYTYKWNEQQTDATLVPASGEDVPLTIRDKQAPGGNRQQTWHFSGRGECRQCHNPWAGEVLGFTEPQLRSPHRADDSLRQMLAVNVVTWGKGSGEPNDRHAPKSLVAPHGEGNLAEQARSYLHVNCAHCHQFGAGGSVDMELKFDTALGSTKAIDGRPVQGTFDIPDAKLIAPGEPHKSLVYYRMAKQGRGRMPHIGSELVDEKGLTLIRSWIRQLPPKELQNSLDTCCRPDADPKEYQQATEQLLATPQGALALLEAWDAQHVSEGAKRVILTTAQKKDAPIRDLFERFVPDQQKAQRLGTIIKPEMLLIKQGNVQQGKELFFNKTNQCVNCHKVGGQGGEIGPALDGIGKKLTPRQLLDSILDTSKDIDAKFAAYVVETDDGRKLTGLLVQRDAQRITLRDPQGKDTTVVNQKITLLEPSKKSLMPEQLLREMTAEQAANLLAYLSSLK